jgi:thiamine pyrophosphokinase
MGDNGMTLSFDRMEFDAVICLQGDLPSMEVFEHLASKPLIAADGAANVLVDIGIGPEFIVGDLDSVTQQTIDHLRGTTELIHETDQDSTDFEKALRFANSQLWHHVLVIGMHGGDLEHTLNNWSVLLRHARELSLTAFDRGRYAIPINTSFRYAAREDELLSLIPQPLAHLTTSGLVWNLSNEPLMLGTREGARNRAAATDVDIEIHSGSLLFFCDARLPYAPNSPLFLTTDH